MNESIKVVVGTGINTPDRLKNLNIETKHLYPSEDGQKIFSVIKDLSKNGGKSDVALIAEKTGFKASYILSWTEGVPLNADINYHASRLRRAYWERQLLEELKGQEQFINKTSLFDTSKAVEIIKKIENEEQTLNEKAEFETLTEFMQREIPERKTFIHPVFGEMEIIMLHGRPKIGKSLLTLYLIRCLVTGEKWLVFEVEKIDQPVLIIQNEIAPSLLQERVKNIFYDVSNEDMEKVIIPKERKEIFFDTKEGRNYMSGLLKNIQPGYVLIDPYSNYFTSLEESLKNPRPFFDFWREQIDLYSLSLQFVHHDAKFQEGKFGGQKALGATLINASSDGNWNIDRILDNKLDPDDFIKHARLSFESRNWQSIRPLDIKLNENGIFEIAHLPKSNIDEWDIYEEIKKAGGQIEQAKLRAIYEPNTKRFYAAKDKAIEMDLIDEVKLKDSRGQPVMLMIKKQEGTDT